MNSLAHTIPTSDTALPQSDPEYTMSGMILSGTNKGNKTIEILPVINDTNNKGISNKDNSITGTYTARVKNTGRKITEREDTISLMQQDAMQHYPYEESQTVTTAVCIQRLRQGTTEDSVVMQAGLGGILKDRVSSPSGDVRSRQITEIEETKSLRNPISMTSAPTSMMNESFPSKTEFTHDSETYYRGYKQGTFKGNRTSVQQSQLIEEVEESELG
eukprot:190428_1